MPTVETTLYYADWCGHCHAFIDKWNDFDKKITQSNGKINGINVIVKKYEDSQIRENTHTINGKPVRGFPTVKIEVKNDDGKKVEYEYTGNRTSEALLEHVMHNSLDNLNQKPKNTETSNE